VKECWWMLNDHNVMKVSEEQVISEALGGKAGSYKSACNLIYINKHILDQYE
jgi:hypothetical protein